MMWFYYDEAGTKQGPLTSAQLKTLATKGVIKPSTRVATDTGKESTAGKVKGLFPEEPIPATIPQAAPVVQDDYQASEPFAPPMAQQIIVQPAQQQQYQPQPNPVIVNQSNSGGGLRKGCGQGMGLILGIVGCLTLLLVATIGGCIVIMGGCTAILAPAIEEAGNEYMRDMQEKNKKFKEEEARRTAVLEKMTLDTWEVTKEKIAFSEEVRFTTTVTNESDTVVESYYVHFIVKKAGRTIPIAEGDIYFAPDTGIEPGETVTEKRTAPSFEGDWYKLKSEDIDTLEITAALKGVSLYTEQLENE